VVVIVFRVVLFCVSVSHSVNAAPDIESFGVFRHVEE